MVCWVYLTETAPWRCANRKLWYCPSTWLSWAVSKGLWINAERLLSNCAKQFLPTVLSHGRTWMNQLSQHSL